MTDLERRLTEAGARWDAPQTPDIASRVSAALSDRRVRHARRRPRRLVVALVAAVVGAGTIAAIAPARDAILRLFSIGDETVKEVPQVPNGVPAGTIADLGLGEPVSLSSTQTGVGFTVRQPTVLPRPDVTFRLDRAGGSMISFLWKPGPGLPRELLPGVSVVMSQFAGEPFFEKLAASESVELLQIGGRPAIWFAGPDHFLVYQAPNDSVLEERGRLTGRALVWTAGGVTYRLEGEFTRAQAIAVAESLEEVG